MQQSSANVYTYTRFNGSRICLLHRSRSLSVLATRSLRRRFPPLESAGSVTPFTHHRDTLHLWHDDMQTIVSRAPLHALADLRDIRSHGVTRGKGVSLWKIDLTRVLLSIVCKLPPRNRFCLEILNIFWDRRRHKFARKCGSDIIAYGSSKMVLLLKDDATVPRST